MGPRRGISPREAPSVGIPAPWLKTPKAGTLVTPVAFQHVLAAVRPTTKTWRQNVPRSGTPKLRRLTAGASPPASRPTTTPTRLPPRRISARSTPRLRGPLAPSPAHVQSPTSLGAIRATPITRSLRGGTLAVTQTAMARRRAT